MQYATMNPQKRKLDQQEQKEADVTLESPLSQPTIKSAFRKATPLEPSNERYQAITDAITHFICKDVAFNAVSRPGFQHLMNVLKPRYKVPSTTTFSIGK